MPQDERIDLRVTGDEKARFEQAATTDGLRLSQWLRRIAKREADRILGRPKTPKR